MEVLDIDIDLHEYMFENFLFCKTDFQVLNQFIDNRHFDLIIRRLDSEEGWNEPLKVLINFYKYDKNMIINVGCSDTQEKTITIETEFDIYESNKSVNRLSSYKMIPCPDPECLSREKFNEIFDTDIVSLPRSLYAAGLHNGKFYMYNDFFADYYEIIHNIRHIISVALTFTNYRNFYFIISAFDGYMLNHYNTVRDKPKYVSVDEYKGQQSIVMTESNEYPVLHKKKYVLGQANHTNMPFVIDMVDRHYFFHNIYHPFRSWHEGRQFKDKRNFIVYGAHNDRGTIYNYTDRRDIEVNQRLYFESEAVAKDNIFLGGFIHRSVQRLYKYILDTDGQVSTWDATAWKLNSGSVIFKASSGWRQWFYDEYKPYVHYIPIKDDFSDLQEKYQWCEEHQEECEQIIRNAKDLFQKVYRYHNIIDYTIKVLDKLNE